MIYPFDSTLEDNSEHRNWPHHPYIYESYSKAIAGDKNLCHDKSFDPLTNDNFIREMLHPSPKRQYQLF